MFGTLMSNAEIVRCVSSGEIVIEPFQPDLCELAHYPLTPIRVYSERFGPAGELQTATWDLGRQGRFVLSPRESVQVEVSERVMLKGKIVGQFVLRSGLLQQGLGFFGGKLDPFYGEHQEKIIFRVANLTERSIPIHPAVPVAHLCFFDLRGTDGSLKREGGWKWRTEKELQEAARKILEFAATIPPDFFEGALDEQG